MHIVIKGREAYSTIKVGDVIIAHDESLPHKFWKMAKVGNLITGQDGKTRGVMVKQATQERQAITLCQPLQLLLPSGGTHTGVQ